MGFSVLGFSVPIFVLGYGLIWLFAVNLELLPVQGYQPIMPTFQGQISEENLLQLIAYIKTLKKTE